MPTSEEIARELESFYRHYVDVFNREDDRFFAYYAPVFEIVSGDPEIISVTNDGVLEQLHEGAQAARMSAVGSRSPKGLGTHRGSRNDHSGHDPPQGR